MNTDKENGKIHWSIKAGAIATLMTALGIPIIFPAFVDRCTRTDSPSGVLKNLSTPELRNEGESYSSTNKPNIGVGSYNYVNYYVKEWRQVGNKVVVIMAIENMISNGVTQNLFVNIGNSQLYDINNNFYKGSYFEMGNSRDEGSGIYIPLPVGAKPVAKLEFDVGDAEVQKVVMLRFAHYGTSYIDISIR